MKYVPKVILEELEDVKREKGMIGDSEAFRKIAGYSQVGREAERLMKLQFSRKPRGRPKGGGWL